MSGGVNDCAPVSGWGSREPDIVCKCVYWTTLVGQRESACSQRSLLIAHVSTSHRTTSRFVVISASTVVGVRMAMRRADIGLGVESSPTAFLARFSRLFLLVSNVLARLFSTKNY